MALEGFNELLHRLKEAHERELEVWQDKIQELTNKKGCSDTQRMEELFNKNQQLREQQRLLTENIKQLENRLRAGLCDRCTVTQEVAKRRQQEYETSQILSIQHISTLGSEMNTMKKENQRLQEEIRHLRAALEGQSGHSSSKDATQGVKKSASLSPSAMPHITPAIRSTLNQPPEGTTAGLSIVKTEADFFRAEETLPEGRHVRDWNGRQIYKSHKPLSMSPPIPRSLRPEHSTARGNIRQKRAHSEGSHLPSTHPCLLDLKKNPIPSSFSSLSTSSSLPGDDKQSRHLVHAPVPYRPLPVKNARLSIPWPLPEHSNWVTLASSMSDGPVVHPNHNNRAHVSNLQTFHQQSSNATLNRKHSTGQNWPKPSHSPQASLTRSPSIKPLERPVAQDQSSMSKRSPQRDAVAHQDRVFGEGLKEIDAPLDLSDPGKSKSKSPQDSNPTMQDIDGETSNRDTRTDTSQYISQPACPRTASSSSSPPASRLSSSSTPPSNQHRQSPSNSNPKEEGTSKMEEDDGKADQGSEMEFGDRKVPVLTISLRPVVLLEALNTRLQKQLSSDGKSAQSIASRSSSDDQDVESHLSGSESSQSTKRKLTDIDPDTEDSHQKEGRMSLLNTLTLEKSQSDTDDRSNINSH
ncbi:RBBP8 N-terminal-like protein isoform X2 [Esox lucius]|uniref:DNA endonuclease Ctp1 N-terminal domain-containing protein n=1 Tax=Esox lucius TaxID=8010 RepID=A0A3P8ZT42_ESOLU|nr:RBBP8 N-terminal-like protein isoform X2 [Esox lucius]